MHLRRTLDDETFVGATLVVAQNLGRHKTCPYGFGGMTFSTDALMRTLTRHARKSGHPDFSKGKKMPNSKLTHHTTFVNDVRLHYVTAGQGDPVVLLHGWPETWYQWRKIIPTLAEKYTVIAPDLRGLGDSSKPASGYDKRAIWTDVEHNKENAKTKLTMPVLALGGKYSFGKRTLTSLQTLAENVRGGEIDHCGHWISEEQPDYLLEQLLTFFGEAG